MKDKWDLRFKNLALEVSQWSKDPSTKVGCIAVKDRKVIATGYNGFPAGISDNKEDYENRDIKYKKIVHAEKNMIYNACQHGVSLVGSTVYVSGLPTCEECWKGLVQVGISRLVMPSVKSLIGEAYERWSKGCYTAIKYMEEAGVEVYQYNPYQIGWERTKTELLPKVKDIKL